MHKTALIEGKSTRLKKRKEPHMQPFAFFQPR